jgi:hypothetical protein
MAYDVSNYATLGLLSDLLNLSNPDAPSDADLALVEISASAISDARKDPTLKTVSARKIAVALPWSANGCAPAGNGQ